MGGENEKVLSSKPAESSSPGLGTAATLKSPTQSNIRMHNNAKEGKVHFHDDARRLKVAIPTAEFWKQYSAWKITPDRPLTFVDAEHMSEVLLTAKRVMKTPPEIDVDIQLNQISVGSNMKALEEFVSGK